MNITPRSLLSLLLLALLLVAGIASPDKWTADIDRLTKGDAEHPPAKGGVVFVGSSSIVMWKTLATDFPGVTLLNRGFGGSELADSVFYVDRVVTPYQPKIVVLYAGDNDLWSGKTPATVVADFKAFRSKVHAALPTTKVIYLSIKASPSRAKVRAQIDETNRLIAADCAATPHCEFVDVNTPMLDAKGEPRPELFLKDQLHLQPSTYAIWTKTLAPHLKP